MLLYRIVHSKRTENYYAKVIHFYYGAFFCSINAMLDIMFMNMCIELIQCVHSTVLVIVCCVSVRVSCLYVMILLIMLSFSSNKLYILYESSLHNYYLDHVTEKE